MKTLLSIRHRISGVLLKMFFVSLLAWACTDDSEVTPVRPDSSSDKLNTQESSNSRDSYFANFQKYNLNVFLQSESVGRWTFGFVKFRQYINETQLIHLDTWVHGLEPNTSYVLQRAVDTTLDGNCTSTSWLTLGEGLVPKSIVTDGHGLGHAELFRSVAAIPVGSTFDIHFQIVKESTSEVVLTSDCYQYTVH